MAARSYPTERRYFYNAGNHVAIGSIVSGGGRYHQLIKATLSNHYN